MRQLASTFQKYLCMLEIIKENNNQKQCFNFSYRSKNKLGIKDTLEPLEKSQRGQYNRIIIVSILNHLSMKMVCDHEENIHVPRKYMLR